MGAEAQIGRATDDAGVRMDALKLTKARGSAGGSEANARGAPEPTPACTGNAGGLRYVIGYMYFRLYERRLHVRMENTPVTIGTGGAATTLPAIS